MTGPKREYPQFKFDSFNLENGLELQSNLAFPDGPDDECVYSSASSAASRWARFFSTNLVPRMEIS